MIFSWRKLSGIRYCRLCLLLRVLEIAQQQSCRLWLGLSGPWFASIVPDSARDFLLSGTGLVFSHLAVSPVPGLEDIRHLSAPCHVFAFIFLPLAQF
jgi:hypothetical protein